MRNFKARAERLWHNDGVSLHLFDNTGKKLRVVTDLVIKEYDDAVIEAHDDIVLPTQTAQELIDGLWDCGLRPSEGSGSAGALKATQEHLKDLQTLSWRLLSMIEKKENP